MACHKKSFLSFLHVIHVFTVNHIKLCKTHFLKIYKISYIRYTYLSSWSDYPSLLLGSYIQTESWRTVLLSMLKVRVVALRPDQCAVETKSDLRCSAVKFLAAPLAIEICWRAYVTHIIAVLTQWYGKCVYKDIFLSFFRMSVRHVNVFHSLWTRVSTPWAR